MNNKIETLLNLAKEAYADGDFAGAKAMLARVQTIDATNEDATKLLALIRLSEKNPGKAKRGRVTMRFEGDGAGDFGSTDAYGLGTFVATTSNKPVAKNPDELPPWDGGVDPLLTATTRKPSTQHLFSRQPLSEHEMQQTAFPQYNTERNRKLPPVIDNSGNDGGQGVPMPTWLAPADKSTRTRRRSAQEKQNRRTMREIAAATRPHSLMNVINLVLEFFQITMARMLIWLGMFLFVLICVFSCYFSMHPIRPAKTTALTPQMQTDLEGMMARKEYDKAIKTIDALKIAKPEKDIKAKTYLYEAYQELGTQAVLVNDLDLAIEKYQKALVYAPKDAKGLVLLAHAEHCKANTLNKSDSAKRTLLLDAAMAHVSKALEADPQSTVALYLGAEIATSADKKKQLEAFQAKIKQAEKLP